MSENELIEQLLAIRNEPPQPLAPQFLNNEAFMAHTIDFVKDFYLTEPSKEKELAPMFTVVANNGQVVPFVTPFVGEPEDMDLVKNTVAQGLRTMMQVIGAVRYSFMSEAWMAKFSSFEDSRKRRKGRPISQLEDKVEVVVIIVSDAENTTSATFELVRDWTSGEVTELKPILEPTKEANSSGRFSNLLQP